MEPLLRPRTTQKEIYGPGVIYSPRASSNASTWMGLEEPHLDFLTGGQLTVMGGMPILCAAGVSTPEGLRLLRDAGFETASEIHRFRGESDYRRMLSALGGEGRRVAVQHLLPVSELPAEHCLVPPAVLSFINNKGNLSELVAAPHVPPREVVPSAGLLRSRPALPCVIKAVTDESTGGGFDVAVCRSAAEFTLAAERFRTCPQVVVEGFIEMRRNLCLNYGVLPDGRVVYIGSAEQVCRPDGIYEGNWIDGESDAPDAAAAIGAAIARAGRDRGYRGCVGIDLAVLEDGRTVVYDLNFRVNGSTASLLLADAIRRNLDRTVIRYRGWQWEGTYRGMLDAVYTAMGRGILLPLSSYDPVAGGHSRTQPRLKCLVLGATREEVRERERELAGMGFAE
ncbi:MAG: ATP-grasp domain-containing protein [bacterium]|nr:ATP-grasp domain-containing protein [bacterium]